MKRVFNLGQQVILRGQSQQLRAPRYAGTEHEKPCIKTLGRLCTGPETHGRFPESRSALARSPRSIFLTSCLGHGNRAPKVASISPDNSVFIKNQFEVVLAGLVAPSIGGQACVSLLVGDDV
jgi:hypothetical protein